MIFVYRSVNPLLKKDEDRFFDPSSLILIDNHLLLRDGLPLHTNINRVRRLSALKRVIK
jgi:hypothetical protein